MSEIGEVIPDHQCQDHIHQYSNSSTNSKRGATATSSQNTSKRITTKKGSVKHAHATTKRRIYQAYDKNSIMYSFPQELNVPLFHPKPDLQFLQKTRRHNNRSGGLEYAKFLDSIIQSKKPMRRTRWSVMCNYYDMQYFYQMPTLFYMLGDHSNIENCDQDCISKQTDDTIRTMFDNIPDSVYSKRLTLDDYDEYKSKKVTVKTHLEQQLGKRIEATILMALKNDENLLWYMNKILNLNINKDNIFATPDFFEKCSDGICWSTTSSSTGDIKRKFYNIEIKMSKTFSTTLLGSKKIHTAEILSNINCTMQIYNDLIVISVLECNKSLWKLLFSLPNISPPEYKGIHHKDGRKISTITGAPYSLKQYHDVIFES